jgi:hypothetical protein
MSDYIILRRETEGFSSRGPVTKALSYEDAAAEAIELKKKFPGQDFVIFSEVGSAVEERSVSIRPASSAPIPMKVRAR